MPTLLLFGASGAIGSSIGSHFRELGWKVTAVGRSKKDGIDVAYDPLMATDASALVSFGPFDAVCWAQGANHNDSIYDVDLVRHREMYDANCLSIVASLNQLLAKDLLSKPARLCVISSIWQDIARPNKFSYCMTKAALQGLVLSAAADLAKDGHLINAVLPGVLDTPMTRANLKPEQIKKFEEATLFNRLPKVEDVVHCVASLLSPQNHSVTGQFVTVDLGFSHVRRV